MLALIPCRTCKSPYGASTIVTVSGIRGWGLGPVLALLKRVLASNGQLCSMLPSTRADPELPIICSESAGGKHGMQAEPACGWVGKWLCDVQVPCALLPVRAKGDAQ